MFGARVALDQLRSSLNAEVYASLKSGRSFQSPIYGFALSTTIAFDWISLNGVPLHSLRQPFASGHIVGQTRTHSLAPHSRINIS